MVIITIYCLPQPQEGTDRPGRSLLDTSMLYASKASFLSNESLSFFIVFNNLLSKSE